MIFNILPLLFGVIKREILSYLGQIIPSGFFVSYVCSSSTQVILGSSKIAILYILFPKYYKVFHEELSKKQSVHPMSPKGEVTGYRDSKY
jgi:hypothetical protein